ncbi:MAG: redox-sensing transcriptional repressor Rex [Oscillospiraceae bacterium]|nr:redox-sensing transcriptional repressor Rex [Oscillospiraceae bacterium]
MTDNKNKATERNVPKPTLFRLPSYLDYLRRKKDEGSSHISTTKIGEDLKLYHVQVRKDLAHIGAVGKPKTGYEIDSLIEKLVAFLEYESVTNAVLVGAGQLGKTLLGFDGFSEYGLNIAAAFDTNKEIIGSSVKGTPVMSVEELPQICEKLNASIGIITVPPAYAQETADVMVKSGIKAIWNFSTVHLVLPDDIIVQNENMAASLAVLRNRLSAQK